MTKHKNKLPMLRPAWMALLGLIGFGAVIAVLLKNADIALLNPRGLIAQEEYNLMLLTSAILMLIAVPTLTLFYFFAWKYRETNESAAYEPDVRHGTLFTISVWTIPSVFLVVLAVIMWSATHRLEPQKAIAADTKPLTIQVIAMRWKWLFIYPEQNIATVNFIQIPTNTPVQFKLTADETPMSSFWIPHLGGQLYAMTGHMNQLNLMAEKPGDYPGSSAEINGSGFAGMKFIARAGSNDDFDRWVTDIQQSYVGLDAAKYEKLLEPSESHAYEYYSNPETGLYDKVVMKYAGSHDHKPAEYHAGHP